MPGRIIAIGDIHGCATALAALIEEIQPGADDLIVPLGDCIDRGTDSRRVVEMLIDLKANCLVAPLMGNHEIMLLQSLEDLGSIRCWLECGGMATVESYGGLEEIPEEHIAFFQQSCRFVETDQFILLHANFDPNLPLEKQPDQLLFWEHVVRTVPGQHRSGKTVIVGHTPQTEGEILDLGHLLCIDTYCVGGGWLTALDLQTGTVWQANKEGELRS